MGGRGAGGTKSFGAPARHVTLNVHLDTSFLIRSLVPASGEDRLLRAWLSSGAVLGMSAIGWAEFLCGPIENAHVELARRVVSERVPLDGDDAELSARLFNLGGRRKGSLTDCMIAATAIRRSAALATTNPADFRRFGSTGLDVMSA